MAAAAIPYCCVVIPEGFLASSPARREVGDPIHTTHRLIDCRIACTVNVAGRNGDIRRLYVRTAESELNNVCNFQSIFYLSHLLEKRVMPEMDRVGHVMKNPNNAGTMRIEVVQGTIATFLVSDLRQKAMKAPTIVPSPPAGIAADKVLYDRHNN